MESKLKKELYEKYKARRDEKLWRYAILSIVLLGIFIFGGNLITYLILR